MSAETYDCPTCHTQSSIHRQRLTPGVVKALVKFRRAIGEHRSNDLHIYRDLTGENELTTSEQMNWTKLRFHALVAKVKIDGVVQRGRWLLTKRGREFLDGDVSLPSTVRTLNNHVIDHDYTSMVNLRDVLGMSVQFDDAAYWNRTDERLPIEAAQVELFS